MSSASLSLWKMREARLLNSAGSVFCCTAAKLVRLTHAALSLREVRVSESAPETKVDGKTSGSNPELESPCHLVFKGTICAVYIHILDLLNGSFPLCN